MIIELDMPPTGSSREFRFESAGEHITGFIVRAGERVYAYRNRCPHNGVSLNWMPDRFLNPEGDLIQCATHGALFRIDDGSCVFGPCAGEALEKLPLRADKNRVKIEIPEA